MRALKAVLTLLAGSASTAAYAECQPAFTSASQVVNIPAPSNLDTGATRQGFSVTIRNVGDADCSLVLAVGRDDQGSRRSFPAYTLTGPSGPLQLVNENTAATNRNVQVDVAVGEETQVAVPYEVLVGADWSTKTGSYQERLVFLLLEQSSGSELARHFATLQFVMQPQIRIWLTADGMNLGLLSPTQETRSQPFGFRVQSTSEYRLSVRSDNQGNLLRDGGTELVPYEMRIAGSVVPLGGSGHTFAAATPIDATGDSYPVSISVQPDPARHAGTYRDKITLSVTTI